MDTEKAVPEGSVRCFNCDGAGTAYAPGKQTCGICAGKGHYSSADFDRWHAKDRRFCRGFCGPAHVRRTGEALKITWDEIFDAIIRMGRREERVRRGRQRQREQLYREVDELLAKYGKK